MGKSRLKKMKGETSCPTEKWAKVMWEKKSQMASKHMKVFNFILNKRGHIKIATTYHLPLIRLAEVKDWQFSIRRDEGKWHSHIQYTKADTDEYGHRLNSKDLEMVPKFHDSVLVNKCGTTILSTTKKPLKNEVDFYRTWEDFKDILGKKARHRK